MNNRSVDNDQWLYRMYDAANELLYVGITKHCAKRFDQHGERLWWRDVAYISVEHFPSRFEVELAELNAIHNENPRYNIARPPLPSRVVEPPQRVATEDVSEGPDDDFLIDAGVALKATLAALLSIGMPIGEAFTRAGAAMFSALDEADQEDIGMREAKRVVRRRLEARE